ncbi:MAG: replication restart helicase PriA [Bacilli bacterium]
MDQLYDYEVSPSVDIQVGQCVMVPFGARYVLGYVVKLTRTDQAAAPEAAQARALRMIDREPLYDAPMLAVELVELAAFLRDRYMCTWGSAISTMLPPVTRTKQKVRYRASEQAGGSPLPEELLRYLKRYRGASRKTLVERFQVSAQQLAKWLEDGSLTVVSEAVQKYARTRATASAKDDPAAAPLLESNMALSSEQQAAYGAVCAGIDRRAAQTFVLRGVTGSGKTEVYLQAIEYALQRNLQAIMLVPEIALTAQMTARFKRRFGARVAVLHSHLAERDKHTEWHRIANGQADVVVGARSAIFAPLARLGLILVDEEHESSYKQEREPRYVVREVAQWRAQRAGAVMVLGSATPSLDAMYRAERGRYQLLTLDTRVQQRPLPDVSVVDMRQELRRGGRSLFSGALREGLHDALAHREQAILFLNRRGFSTVLLCRECGEAATCPHCDVSLTLHKTRAGSLLRCHFCGHSEGLRTHCAGCGSVRVRQFGAGTQRVEHELLELFPGLRVVRMDVDTTTAKGAHERLLAEFERGDADVLLGTQMIAKGLDFERVSLVGVVAADTSLHVPDFRAAERTFQLLVQVAGRAGRHLTPGRMIVQTFAPDHYAILAAARQDYGRFYETELAARKMMEYPPFTEITQFMIAHRDEPMAQRHAAALQDELARRLQSVTGVRVLPAAPAAVPRAKGLYRYQVTALYRSFAAVRSAVQDVYRLAQSKAPADLSIIVDVNAHSVG